MEKIQYNKLYCLCVEKIQLYCLCLEKIQYNTILLSLCGENTIQLYCLCVEKIQYNFIVSVYPPGSRLLALGVFKPSCSTPFTLFLCLASVYRSFQLYFIPKLFHNTSLFSSLFAASLYLTGHSPVFICNTSLLYIVLLALCSHL